jgi:GntR family transcriptional regulator
MLIRIDVNSEETLYSQLSNQVKYGIAKGYILPGEALPSVRGLASELSINMHTVAKAYAMLKEEDIIIINRGKGVKVSNTVLKNRNNSYDKIFHKKMSELVAEGICNGISKQEFLEKVKESFTEIGGK